MNFGGSLSLTLGVVVMPAIPVHQRLRPEFEVSLGLTGSIRLVRVNSKPRRQWNIYAITVVSTSKVKFCKLTFLFIEETGERHTREVRKVKKKKWSWQDGWVCVLTVEAQLAEPKPQNPWKGGRRRQTLLPSHSHNRQRGADLAKFKGSWVYRASSRIARAM